ncbi:hypothetical protein E3E12_03500 [Formicincola oecophyllae]|uniref:Uncharacterized protein n=1 Tax=Formicincola oecophyllae TaxID=2558361 RepID=A0A4Y6U7V2_9PROT|nr:hypothetical protein [Formicincola oecophyllae]QDH13422.1 hypothetical protein E3E12_03500 [Formicincola oecophyllae]
MAILTEAERMALPNSAFALEARRAFPIMDKDHAEAALMDAPLSLRAGHITPAQKEYIDACAHEVLRTGKPLAELRAEGWKPTQDSAA